MSVMTRWADRIHHVHDKDIRPDVISCTRENKGSFLDAVTAGAFTVPCDGCIDSAEVTSALKRDQASGLNRSRD